VFDLACRITPMPSPNALARNDVSRSRAQRHARHIADDRRLISSASKASAVSALAVVRTLMVTGLPRSRARRRAACRNGLQSLSVRPRLAIELVDVYAWKMGSGPRRSEIGDPIHEISLYSAVPERSRSALAGETSVRHRDPHDGLCGKSALTISNSQNRSFTMRPTASRTSMAARQYRRYR
jgi:hypothetical protein